MNLLKLEAPWKDVKELLKEINTDLTDEDLRYNPQQADELLERLAAKMNRSKEHIKEWIKRVSYNRGKAS